MSLGDLFASNLLVRWLRGDPGRYDLLTQMIGARLGDRILTVGAGDTGMVTAIARVAGLSGRAVAHASTPDEAARLTIAAEQAGVLVELAESPPTSLPFSEGDFDLVLVDAISAAVEGVLPEVRRVLRPGGRVVLVVRQKAPQAPAPAAVLQQVASHFKGARIPFERDGYALVEALKGAAAPPPA
ncbi:MAG TPA: methyltransferase domain-containing protein [Luteitalea sp.]|nr:methyltransferase domain-containing protein [Luteitalea sp.]